jgi:hypothetical protein
LGRVVPFITKPFCQAIDHRRQNIVFIDPEDRVIQIRVAIGKSGVEAVHFAVELSTEHGRHKEDWTEAENEKRKEREH